VRGEVEVKVSLRGTGIMLSPPASERIFDQAYRL
jgi:hypothetical protein